MEGDKIMELTQEEKMMLAAKQQMLLRKVLHESKPRCHKCVYELRCSKDKDNERNCPDYKRDAPDGGYYG